MEGYGPKEERGELRTPKGCRGELRAPRECRGGLRATRERTIGEKNTLEGNGRRKMARDEVAPCNISHIERRVCGIMRAVEFDYGRRLKIADAVKDHRRI